MKRLSCVSVLGIAILVLLIVPGLLLAQEKKGAWVLEGVKPDFVKRPKDDAYSTSSSSNKAGEGIASITCNWPANFSRKETVTVAGYWSDPPQKILPGQKVSLNMTFKVLANTMSSCGSSLSFVCIIQHAGADWGTSGTTLVDPQKPKNPIYPTFTADSRGPAAGAILSMVGEAVPPAALEGNKLQIRCSVGEAERISYVYLYRWDASGGGEVPGSPPVVGPGSGSDCEQTTVSTMTLLAGKRQVKAGETVTLPVCLIKGSGVADMNFNVTFNASVAQATQAAKGSLIPAATLFEANTGQAGNVRMGFAGNKDFGGTGPVAQLTFKAVGKPGDRTPLRVVVTTLGSASGAKPSIATIDGEIQIVGDTPSTTTTIPTTTSPTTTTTTTTLPPKEIKGDCDGNGKLNAADALCALKMSVGLVPINMRTDMDNDGKVTSTDARLILQKVVGK